MFITKLVMINIMLVINQRYYFFTRLAPSNQNCIGIHDIWFCRKFWFQRRKTQKYVLTNTKLIRTWPTRVLMRVFLSRLSLCSVTLICCLMISADVIGRLGLASCGTVNDNDGDIPLDPP